MTERQYKIFISSPSDVRPERAIAERVIARMAREFAHYCDLKPVLWEREPLLASHHFQDLRNIPAPSTTDICLVVLWSRLGIPLPADQFRGAISGREVTGTEWEFEDALQSFRQRGTPDLMLYQKTADIVASLSDEAVFEELRRQKRLVAEFHERWFRAAGGDGFTAASHEFATTADFEDRLEEHLRALLRRRLERDLGTAAQAGGITWTEPPWPALASFDVAQAPIFFGRTKARNELRELLAAQVAAGTAFVLVMGASGSGKSSLVKAGLLPDLMLPGMLGDVGLVRYGVMRPTDAGADTLRALAEAMLSPTALPELAGLHYAPELLAEQLRRHPAQAAFAVRQGLDQAAQGKLTALGQARLVLVVDQLEELFTADAITGEERAIFIGALTALAHCGLVWVVATMRADFFDRLEQLPELADLSEAGRYLLLPPNRSELVEIVGRPARAAGLRFEVRSDTAEKLDEVIVNEAAHDPGALPLLSFALDRLWRQPRSGSELTFAAYAKLGELEGAIAHHAEQVVSDLPDECHAALPGLLLGVVALREADTHATGRTSRLDDLARNPTSRLVIDRLVAGRLLIADETAQGTSVRLAHEALLRSWPRLAGLIDQSREALAAMTRLRADLALWERSGRPADLLLPRGKRLSEGLELLKTRPDELGEALAGFIRASAEVATAATRQRRRLVAASFALLSVLTVAAGFGAWFGFSSRDAFQRQFQIAERSRAQTLALLLQTESNPKIAETVALSVLPRQPGKTSELGHKLPDRLVVAANATQQRLVLFGHSAGVYVAVFSADGTRIATASKDQTARVWSAVTGVPQLTLTGHDGEVLGVAFNPDGSRVATASQDKTARIWDARSGARLMTLTGHTSDVNTVTFSPDGRQLLTASSDGTARVWDAGTGALKLTLAGHKGFVSRAFFSEDGSRIVTASEDQTARVWSAIDGRLLLVLTGHQGILWGAAFSPDGSTIATASDDRTVRIWDSVSGALLRTLTGHTAAVQSVAFSPDGARLISTAEDNTARIWDAANGALLSEIIGHSDPVYDAFFSPDGRRIVTASFDHTARVWEADKGALARLLIGHTDTVEDAKFSPDGSRIVSASKDATARVWNVATGALLATLKGHRDMVTSAAFSPDGTRIVTSSLDGTARVWDSATGSPVMKLKVSDDFVSTACYSPDGSRILTSGDDKIVRLWDAASGHLVMTLPGHTGEVFSAAFSPDGRRIVTASADRTARIWDAHTGAVLMILAGHEDVVRVAAFSPDGTRIVTASNDRTARVWNAATGALLGTLAGHEDRVESAAFSPDGRRIVTASRDGTARVWDTASLSVRAVLARPGGAIYSAVFSHDGKQIATGSDDGTVRLWNAPDDFSLDDLSFIRATASLGLNSALRAKYALPAVAQAADQATAPHCDGDGTAAWTKGAADGQAACHQRLAERYEAGQPGQADLAHAFFHHAVAARLFEEQRLESAAQQERYRREALAWLLPRQQAGRLMDAADTWQPGTAFPP
jgi:WD40 repeat protein